MTLTRIVTGVIEDGTITSTDMAVDPRNASNLNAGDVPLAQLGNVEGTTGIQEDVAILAFKTQANGNLARYNLIDQSVDSFEDASGINTGASTGENRNSAGKYYSGGVEGNWFGDGSDGSLTTSANVTHTVQNKVGSYDGDMVVKNYTSLTISAGHTMTVDQPCRGMLIYVSGNCTINGTLSMTGKGGLSDPTAAGGSDSAAVNASGIQLPMLKSGGSSTLAAATFAGAGNGAVAAVANQPAVAGNGVIFAISKAGGAGGTGPGPSNAVPSSSGNYPGGAYGNIVGVPGTSGTTGGVTLSTGGGGSGGLYVMSSGAPNAGTGGLAGSGGLGGAFSGGAGGGGVTRGNSSPGTTTAGSGGDYGGAGGAGVDSAGGGAAGGAGNAGGAGAGPASPTAASGGSGVGGIIFLVVGGTLTIGGSGSIQADGSDGGMAPPTSSYGGNFPSGAGGGGSGGGAVFALHYGALSNSGAITAAKGDKGTTSIQGGGSGAGGDGGVGGVHTSTVDVAESFTNMTLISNGITASPANPTKGDIVLTYTDGAGTASINTDLIASISRDGGTNYTDVTLVNRGTTSGQTILTASDVNISGQPAGSSMVWKVACNNQSSAKSTRIHGVSLGWS